MKRPPSHAGFTLIELIVSLVVAAVFGTMLVTLMHSVFIRGGEPINAVGNVHKLTRAMDQITAYYNSQAHLSRSTSGGTDALNELYDHLVNHYSNDEFNFDYRWYTGSPFDDGHGHESTRQTGDDFLKVTLSLGGANGSLTSLFWSGN
ncbi:MAG: type II secretion system protein [Thermodesulfobacteriota bacterium]|nr:type II secretion system protein [Thermodesulfobacteriota bacterium]